MGVGWRLRWVGSSGHQPLRNHLRPVTGDEPADPVATAGGRKLEAGTDVEANLAWTPHIPVSRLGGSVVLKFWSQ
jgi:hypothetical protein